MKKNKHQKFYMSSGLSFEIITLCLMLPFNGRSPASARCSSACPVRSEAHAVAPSLQRDLLWAYDRPSPDTGDTRIHVIYHIYRPAGRQWRCLSWQRMAWFFLKLQLTNQITHLYDLPDFTLGLQFVQLNERHPDRFVAPQETAVRRHTATASPSHLNMWHQTTCSPFTTSLTWM